jgi:SRSO17 transposase
VPERRGGTKGARLHDWAYLELADLDAAEYGAAASGVWIRGLLIRRGVAASVTTAVAASVADADLAFFSTWCPAGTRIEALVSVESRRWAIEDSFKTAKNELGRLFHESGTTRPAPGMAGTVMSAGHARLRHDGRDPAPRQRRATPKNNAPPEARDPALIRWSIQESRRIATRLAKQRIDPARVIAWSLWRRAHQAAARQDHIKRKMQR